MQQEPAPMVNGSTPRPLHPAGGYFSHPSQSFPENPSNMNRSLNPLVPHWARPSTTGQGSAPRWTAPPNNTHENQPSISQNVRTNGVPLHPTPPNLNLGRPPSAPVISPKSSEPPLNQFLQNPSQIPPINHREGQFPSSGITNSPSTAMQNQFKGNGSALHVNGTQYPTSVPAPSTSYGAFPNTNSAYSSGGPPSFQLLPTQSSAANLPPIASATNSRYPTIGMNGASQSPMWSGATPNLTARPMYPPAQGHPAPSAQPQPPPLMDVRRPYPSQQAGNAMPTTGHNPNFSSSMNAMMSQMNSMSVTQTGFDKLWGVENVDLLQMRHILPPQGVEVPVIRLRQEHFTNANCSPDIFRCTLTKIPDTNSILQKSRLPLGILIHPFKDLTQLPVVQCPTIVRCRSCRTYINPFVHFVPENPRMHAHPRWKCNLCFRDNDLPTEFLHGDPAERPEIKNATIEFIAPAEYMLRPPQPSIYLYLLDVCHNATETGYLKLFCDVLLEELENIPGDSRTQIGFITYDSSVHFYSLAPGQHQPYQMIVTDIDDIYLPCPNDLLVNLNESKKLVIDLLEKLPTKFTSSQETSSALGAALQAAYKLVSPTGGRVTVFHASLPNVGPGELKSREDPNQRAGQNVPNLNPATDFYKKLALDCSGQQVAVDLFLMGGQYMDIASLSCVSKYSGGSVHHFPNFHYIHNQLQAERLERSLRRYLIRKIGFESVMRIRCTRGLAIHTFHGNFFVRSTDLLSLPNINPDAGFGVQVSIEENLTDLQNVCFQAALLYTSSKGERRIRVHTMCLPISSTVAEVIQSADQQCIVGLLAKMAVDRSMTSSITDARDALINVCVDVLSAYKATLSSVPQGLNAPANLRLLPLYVAALLKSVALRTGQSTRLDDRVFAMNQFKVLPLSQLMLCVYPDLYSIHNLNEQGAISKEDMVIPQPPHLHLSAEMVDSTGAYLMDAGDIMYLYVGRSVSPLYLEKALGSPSVNALPEQMFELPDLDTIESERLRSFVGYLQSFKPFPAVLQLIREDSVNRPIFINHLIDSRTESSLSYFEFLQHLKTQVQKS